jgi:exopolysaccharide production protein ExoQ
MVALGAFACSRMSAEQILRLTFVTTLGYVAVGLATEGVLGTFRPWEPGYRFAGTLHPNIQGMNCALVLLSGVSLAHASPRWRPALTVVLPLALILLLLTRSRTSLAALLLALLFYALLSPLRRRRLLLAASLCLAGSFFSFAGLVGQGSAALRETIQLGRVDSDPRTLTGRTEVWRECLTYARERPWLGYGYDGFWFPGRIEEVSEAVRWPITHGHSAYVEVLLGLGCIGLAAFVCILAMGMWRASRIALETRSTAELFAPALLVFCAVQGLLEPTIVTASFLTFFYLTILARLGFREGPKVCRVYGH